MGTVLYEKEKTRTNAKLIKMKTKTILATAYAVHPTKGSEDAMGWNYVMQIARHNKVICITRENNQEAIDKHIAENPDPIFDNIQFAYFDTPKWTRFWKKGSRGAMLYYWMWQRTIPNFVKTANLKFDIAHNVTFPNDWTPSYLWKLGKPFIWGPIGHHPAIPKQYLKPYALKYWLKDRATWLIKNYFWKCSPALKRTAKKADYIYAMNSSVAERIPLIEGKYVVNPSVATQDFGCDPFESRPEFEIISAGRFVPLKGFDLTILSFAKFVKQLPKNARSKVKLTLVGKGPEEEYLKKLIQSEGIVNHVELISWIERSALMERMKKADAFLFPSHEGAGMVVAEALSFGLPVICLDNCGPGEYINEGCGFVIPEGSYHQTVDQLSESIQKMYKDPKMHVKMKSAARDQFLSRFHWDKRGDLLKEIYNQVELGSLQIAAITDLA